MNQDTPSPEIAEADSPETLPPNPFVQAIYAMARTLALFALGTLALCILTYYLTQPRIEENRRHALEKTLTEVLPKTYFDNDLLSDTIEIPGEPVSMAGNITAYRATLAGKPTGIIVPVAAPEGYGGTIRLLVGIDPEGVLTGVRVLPPHPETPGLGDAIEANKSPWILQFAGKSLKNPAEKSWAVKKDGGAFDAFTGATITPRAVVKAVKNALVYFDQEGKPWFEEPLSEKPLSEKPLKDELLRDKPLRDKQLQDEQAIEEPRTKPALSNLPSRTPSPSREETW